MEKKENTGTKLNVLLCNLVDYVRGDDRPLVFAVMQEITEYFEQELDKAREEGRREGSEITSRYISDFVKSESGKSGRKEILEYIEELSKLKNNKGGRNESNTN